MTIPLEEENKTKKDYETVFILGGYLSGMLLLGLHTWITLKAFFNDSKSITIHVNRYGEQYGDILTFIFFWALCLIGLLFLFNRIKNQKLQSKNSKINSDLEV